MIKKNMTRTVLVVALCGLLAGCGAKEKLPGDEIVIDPAGDVETTVDSTGDDGAQSDAHENGTAGSQQAQEPYILTFEATTTEGETLTSDIFAQSKLTMINVWATYCNPCLAEMPDLGEIATEYEVADFQMIGIISDVMAESTADEMDYAKELITQTNATTYPHLLLNESLYVNLVGAVSALPTTFFVNQEGELLGYLTGAQAKITWTSLIDDLLSEME